MKLLLDTCTFIWLAQEPAKLSSAAIEALDDAGNVLYLSHVSIWEIYNKSASGKLRLPGPARAWVDEQLAARAVADFPIDRPSLGRMSELPLHHRDPFDRLLVAQALTHNLVIVSPDASFVPYGAQLLWPPAAPRAQ